MATDNLLVIHLQDEKLAVFMRKMGYNVTAYDGSVSLPELLPGKLIDLVVVDGRGDLAGPELCEFLQADQITRDAPVVYLAPNTAAAEAIRKERFAQLQIATVPYRVGQVASTIATALRLRKMAGADEHTSSLAEANAALRELTARYSKELQEARQIQEDLLPPPLAPDPRFDLAFAYEPLEEVGGDWYYYRPEPSGAISLLIADVTGHGLSAALIGSMTKLALAAAESDEPGKILKRMNRLMSPGMPGGKFVTLFCLRYDPATGEVRYARAGHPPVLLLTRATSTVQELRGDGFAIGFDDDAEYLDHGSSLAPGDFLIAYSDGLIEAQNRAGEVYHFSRLAEVMKATKPEDSAEKIKTSILEDFTRFCDGRILKDDVTMIVLKRSP